MINDRILKRNINEKKRHSYRFTCAMILVCIEVLIFYFVWTVFYNPYLRHPYVYRGNLFMLFAYGVLILLFGTVYGGMKLGYYRAFSIFMSSAVSACVANFTVYIAVIIPAATWYLSPVPAVIYMSLMDLLVILVWSLVSNRIFGLLFPPQRLLLISGNAADDITAKFESRRDRYDIIKRIDVYNTKLDFDEICEEILNYDGVIIGDVSSEERNDYLKFCYSNMVRTYTLPKLSDVILKSGETLHIFDSPLYLNRNHGLHSSSTLVKRIFDIVSSLIAIVLLSPLLIITAAAIKLEDGGPVFFRQDRCTIGGRVFSIIKFRSMVVDAEKFGEVIPCAEKDPRITKVGKIIRATRIDELPQLFNILFGDMSVVGPRPERVEHVKKYTEDIPEFSYRMLVKGGLTGYAQVYGKYNTTAYDKLKLDLMYIQNYSFMLDMEIIFKTIQVIFMKESTEGFSAEAADRLRGEDGENT